MTNRQLLLAKILTIDQAVYILKPSAHKVKEKWQTSRFLNAMFESPTANFIKKDLHQGFFQTKQAEEESDG